MICVFDFEVQLLSGSLKCLSKHYCRIGWSRMSVYIFLNTVIIQIWVYATIHYCTLTYTKSVNIYYIIYYLSGFD